MHACTRARVLGDKRLHSRCQQARASNRTQHNTPQTHCCRSCTPQGVKLVTALSVAPDFPTLHTAGGKNYMLNKFE